MRTVIAFFCTGSSPIESLKPFVSYSIRIFTVPLRNVDDNQLTILWCAWWWILLHCRKRHAFCCCLICVFELLKIDLICVWRCGLSLPLPFSKIIKTKELKLSLSRRTMKNPGTRLLFTISVVRENLLSTKEVQGLEINNRLSNGQISLDSPRQVEELGCDEFEDLVHIYVVGCTRKEKCCVECFCISSCLQSQLT